MHSKFHTTAGFTLVEILVAAAVFAIVMVIAVDVFVLVLRKPLKQVDTQHVQEELNYVFEKIASDVRTKGIDYTTYPSGFGNPQTEIYLTNGSTKTRLYLSAGRLFHSDTSIGSGAVTTVPLTTSNSSDVVIDQMTVYVYPTTDPTKTTGTVTNHQEAIVLYLAGHSTADPTKSITAQTVFTLRYYAR